MNRIDRLTAILMQLHSKRILIEYTSGYKDETTHRSIDPLGLCFYGGHWHLLACVRFNKDIVPFVGDQKYYFGLVEEKPIDRQVEMHFLTASYDHMSH